MTFSLLGRCSRTGRVGGTITTSSPSVGARCLFLRTGVGAVLTQAITDPRLGPRGLDLLGEGVTPERVVAALQASTPDIDWRQLAVLDWQGRAALCHGARNRAAVAGVVGRDCVAIGNILANTGVCKAMTDAFEAQPEADLADRLLAALLVGQAAGGEGGPLRSAALQIVDASPVAVADLRIDASEDPLAALVALWHEYRPLTDLYQSRALNPSAL
ncbi:DUF1028 domain-containing protein [Haematobacter genomosp. 1]|uniref:Fimbrial assembly protein FimA n=1 Tax=Haematobacter genomosp. 1 TaxID=366618 RepID=A0A212AAG7_9RHOB|nr:DUF1028 domain-containing protein [Haematobacter genomosp. 1]OWJ77152.1 hypothetical protein CDV49_12095 [Haematobacter genomosp. 1]